MQNDPTRAGQLAAPKELFGPDNRFAIAPVHTRFDAVQWFVWDAEILDHMGMPEVIRQESTKEDALKGVL